MLNNCHNNICLQLMKLQSRFNQDERFKMDQKFLDSDSEGTNSDTIKIVFYSRVPP